MVKGETEQSLGDYFYIGSVCY